MTTPVTLVLPAERGDEWRWTLGTDRIVCVDQGGNEGVSIDVPADSRYADWQAAYEVFEGFRNLVEGRSWDDDGEPTYSCIDCPALDRNPTASAARRHAEENNHCVVEDTDD